MHRYISSISPHLHRNMPFRKKREQSMMNRLGAGQPGAWAQLVDQWSPNLYSYIVYNIGDNAGDDDRVRKLMHQILSDTIHTIIGKPQVQSLTVVIFSIAYRHVLHYRRQQLMHVPLTTGKAQSTTVSMNERHQQRPSFILRFRQFSPETQQLLLLRYVCKVSLAELSQIVGQSEDLLAQTLYRAKLYLQ